MESHLKYIAPARDLISRRVNCPIKFEMHFIIILIPSKLIMDYKVPSHIEIDTYFSTIPVSEWHRLNDYINSKLGTSPLSTAPDLYRSFHRSLAIVEKNEGGSYPKYIVDYAKKLKTAVKVTFANKSHFSKAVD